MATHSSILAWKIPGTEEPGGPQSVVLQSLFYQMSVRLLDITFILLPFLIAKSIKQSIVFSIAQTSAF